MKQANPAFESGLAKKWFLLIVAGLFLTLAAGGSAVWALKKKTTQDDGEEEAPKNSARRAPPSAVPVYVRLEPFTLKLLAEQPGLEQYLQLVPELRASDLLSGERIKAYLPQVRNDMLRLMSAKKASELATPQGIEQLAIELRAQANQILGDSRTPPASGAQPGPDDPVRGVFFSSFIIQ